MESEGSRWQNAGLIRLIKGAVQFIEQAEEMMGRDWVERLADVIVAGDLSTWKRDRALLQQYQP